MKKIQRIIGGLLIYLLIILAGCNSSNDELQQNKFSQRYLPLRADTVAGLEEIKAWDIMGLGEVVSIVQHNLAINRLTVISEQSQKVALFLIDDEKTIAKRTVEIPNLRVLGVDEEGEDLLVGRFGQTLNTRGGPREYFHWFALWNVTSGSIDNCISESCTGELTDPDDIAYADIGAVMDAETVVVYNEDAYRTVILSPGNGGGVALVNSPDDDYWWRIGRIVVNSYQNRLAIVFKEGGIILHKISEPEGWLPLAWTDVLVRGEENLLQPIQAAIFDPGSTWLAIVRGQDLIIWRVRRWQREVFRVQVGNVCGMQFNPSGELLFLGRDNAIWVISVKERSKIVEMQAPGITTLDISNDNRLLFWGDEHGTVHTWGIPVRK